MEENCYIYRYRPLENFYKWDNDEKDYCENKKQHVFDEIENDYFYCSRLYEFDDINEIMFNIDFTNGNEGNFEIFIKYYHYCLIHHAIELINHSEEMNKKVFQEYRNRYAVIGYDSKDCVQKQAMEIISQDLYEKVYKKFAATAMICKKILTLVKKNQIDNFVNGVSMLLLLTTCGDAFLKMSKVDKYYQPGKIKTIINNFTKDFLNQLYTLVLRCSRTCCFSEINNSDYMWSKYANGSKGVCLIYKATKRGNDYNIDSDWREAGTTIGGIHLKKVKYIKGRRRIDFFKYCLGAKEICKNCPRCSKEQIFSGMFNLEKYRKSKTKKINYDEDVFPKIRKMLEDLIATKIDCFKQEKEIRIILDDFSMPKDGKYHCDFSQLDGIIFGENIDENCQNYIVDLIKKKCKKINRDFKTFNFYKFENRRVIRI